MKMATRRILYATVFWGLVTCTSGRSGTPRLPPAAAGERAQPPGARENAFFFVERVKDGVYVYLSPKGKKEQQIDPALLTFEEMSPWKVAFSSELDSSSWEHLRGARITVYNGHRRVCEGTLERPRVLGAGTPWGVLKLGYHDDTFENAGVVLDTIHEVPEKDLRSKLPIADFWKRMTIRPAARVTGCAAEVNMTNLWAQVTPDSISEAERMETVISDDELKQLHAVQMNQYQEHVKKFSDEAGEEPENYVEYQIERMKRGLADFNPSMMEELNQHGHLGRAVFNGNTYFSITMTYPLSLNECEVERTAILWKRTTTGWKQLYSRFQFGERITILGDIDGDGRMEFLRQDEWTIELLRETPDGVEKVATFAKTNYFQEC